MAQDAIRLRINAEKHVASLEAIKAESELTGDEAPTKSRIAALRLSADISLALLKKVQPDLKHVEVSGDDDSPLVVKLVSFSA